MSHGPKHEELQQSLNRLRIEQNRSLFISSVAGVGFTAAMLLGSNSITVMVLLLISLSFFTLPVFALLLASEREIAGLKKLMRGHSGGGAAQVAAYAESTAQAAFALGILLLIAATIVHLSVGGVA